MDDRFRKAPAHRFQPCHSPCRRAGDEVETALEAETKIMATLIAPLTGQCASILSTITETELAGG